MATIGHLPAGQKAASQHIVLRRGKGRCAEKRKEGRDEQAGSDHIAKIRVHPRRGNHFAATEREVWRLGTRSGVEPGTGPGHARGQSRIQGGKGDAMDLAGKILIAMPGLGDPRFERSVILVCAHSQDGAMGIVVNKPASELSFAGLLEQLNIPVAPEGRDIRVHVGGPVERGRGFVLHSSDWRPPSGTSMSVPGGFEMTATLDILEALAKGGGPEAAILALGYAGWGPGQLEAEIGRNDWLTADPEAGLVFSRDDGGKWAAALRRMGIDPVTLSASAGRA